MLSRRLAAVAAILLLIIATAVGRVGLQYAIVRLKAATGWGSASERAVFRTLATLAHETPNPISVLSETPDVDGFVRLAARDTWARSFRFVRRDPAAVAEAVQSGALVAGQRGRAYLEVLGYRTAWLPQDPAAPSFPWARVVSRDDCAAVGGDAWSALPGLAFTGRLGIVLPPAAAGSMTLIVGDNLPLDLDIAAADGTHVRMERQTISSHAALPPDFWLEGGTPYDAPRQVQQLVLRATPDRPRVISVRLGRRAMHVLARLRDYPQGTRAEVCAPLLGVDEAFARSERHVLTIDMPEHFAAGWSDAMRVGTPGNARWMRDHGVILVPSAKRATVRVLVGGWGAGDDAREAARVSLRVNDTLDLEEQPLVVGWKRYEWLVPEAVWLAGTNELLLRVTGGHADRMFGVNLVELIAR